jgi:hypothetical protein
VALADSEAIRFPFFFSQRGRTSSRPPGLYTAEPGKYTKKIPSTERSNDCCTIPIRRLSATDWAVIYHDMNIDIVMPKQSIFDIVRNHASVTIKVAGAAIH